MDKTLFTENYLDNLFEDVKDCFKEFEKVAMERKNEAAENQLHQLETDLEEFKKTLTE